MKQSMKETQRKTLLPQDSAGALDVMTQLTRQMLEFVLEEGKILKTKDAKTLTKIQKGKELRAAGYSHAASEFKDRMAEFKGMDDALIGKLEALTVELGKASRANQKLIETMAPKKPINETMANNLFLLQGEQVAGTAQ